MMMLITVVLISVVGTYAVRQYANRKSIVDIPNERSSHAVGTPTGGGVGILVALFTGCIWLSFTAETESTLLLALLSVMPIIIVSLIDDLSSLSVAIRMGVQAVCAIGAIVVLGGINSIDLGFVELHGAWLNAVAFLAIVWLTNLYNFLDGIDGYAGAEAVFVGVAAFLLFGNYVGLIVAAATIGFLLFSWHKASIFMGDVGSASLGFVMAVLAFHDASEPSFLGWVVLLSLFWFDATVTLVRRAVNGERLFLPHKKHAYQRLHQAGWSHDRVVLMGMSMNVVMLGMLWLSGAAYYWTVLLMVIPLLWLAMKFVDRKKAFQ